MLQKSEKGEGLGVPQGGEAHGLGVGEGPGAQWEGAQPVLFCHTALPYRARALPPMAQPREDRGDCGDHC